MTERPILFSASMVRAILDGSKTQTRRILRGSTEHKGEYNPAYLEAHRNSPGWASICPYGQPGDRLWVRETTEIDEQTSDSVELSRYSADGAPVLYSGCDDLEFNGAVAVWDYHRRSRPSIHMPRWASRILLEIVSVRVERLQDISDDDAYAEGAQSWAAEVVRDGNKFSSIMTAWRALWESTGGDWDANPWVWVIIFKRVTP